MTLRSYVSGFRNFLSGFLVSLLMYRGSLYEFLRDDNRHSWKSGFKLSTRGYTYLVQISATLVYLRLGFHTAGHVIHGKLLI